MSDEAQTSWKVGETKFGKSIEIVRKWHGKFEIELRGGGRKPKELAGKWGWTEANYAVKAYLARVKRYPMASAAEELGVAPGKLASVLEEDKPTRRKKNG